MKIFARNTIFADAILTCLVLLLLAPPVLAAGSRKPGTGSTALDAGETQHLVFMREEEKLARDVYLTLGEIYPDLTPFASIDGSEQRHFDRMGAQLDKYGVDDPNTDDAVGTFTGLEYGDYFGDKFRLLVEWGAENRLDALYVGAYIEELDMHDIVHCPDIIVDTPNGIGEDQCGLLYTDEPSLITSYENLLEGSKDHLRAFVRSIETIIGKGNYSAQVLSQDEVDEILDAEK